MAQSLALAVVGALAAHACVLAIDGDVTNGPEVEWIALSVLAGQVLAGLRFGLALAANPLSLRYLRRHLRTHRRWTTGPVPGEPHDVGTELLALGLDPAITTQRGVDGSATTFDLYQHAERLITAGVSRVTGEIAYVTRLSDGRLVHTARLQMLPNEGLVVNTVPQADPKNLLRAHVSVLGLTAMHGATPVAAEPAVWGRANDLEFASYVALGPVLGSFCNLMGGRAWGRLLVRVDPEQVLDLALPRRRAVVEAEYGTSPLAEAFGGAAPAFPVATFG